MGSAEKPSVSEVLPGQAWEILMRDPAAVLVDVRTGAEWAFVGIPDLDSLGRAPLLVEWAQLPGMSINPDFVAQVMAGLGGEIPSRLLFLCRSGVRSLHAARAVKAGLGEAGRECECLNVATGFEGDLDGKRHRGNKNGWKVAGLPWRQT